MTSSGGELELQAAIDKVAKDRGWRKFALPTVQRRRVAGTQWSKGWPDRVFWRRGYVIVLEMKPEDGRDLTDEQELWLAEWKMLAEWIAASLPSVVPNPVRVAVVRPSDYDEVVRWFA